MVSYLALLQGLDLHPPSPLLPFTPGQGRAKLSVQPRGKCFAQLCQYVANGTSVMENLFHNKMTNTSDRDAGFAGVTLSLAILSILYLSCSIWGCSG